MKNIIKLILFISIILNLILIYFMINNIQMGETKQISQKTNNDFSTFSHFNKKYFDSFYIDSLKVNCLRNSDFKSFMELYEIYFLTNRISEFSGFALSMAHKNSDIRALKIYVEILGGKMKLGNMNNNTKYLYLYYLRKLSDNGDIESNEELKLIFGDFIPTANYFINQYDNSLNTIK